MICHMTMEILRRLKDFCQTWLFFPQGMMFHLTAIFLRLIGRCIFIGNEGHDFHCYMAILRKPNEFQ